MFAIEPGADETWRSNEALARREFANGATILQSMPTRITYDPGSVCNLRCVQCARENPANNFQEERADPKIAEQLFPYLPYLKRLSLYGLGEPLLSPVFWDLIYASPIGAIPELDIHTNGTLLSDKNVGRLLRSHLKSLSISLDGATPETFKRIRAGKLEKIVAGIARLTEGRQAFDRPDFRVSISMTIMMENIKELPLMIKLAHSLGVDAVWAQHLIVRSDDNQNSWILRRGDWTFDYQAQHCSQNPKLSNEMVSAAKSIADELGVEFCPDNGIWFPK